MGLGTTYLTRTQLREFLGVTPFVLRRLLRQEGFPAPGTDLPALGSRFDVDDEPRWDAAHVYRWAAHDRDLAHRGAVLLRADPHTPAPGGWAGALDTPQGPAIDWRTDIGVVRVVHTDDSRAASAAATALANSPTGPGDIAVVCAFFGDIGFTGPALVAADTAHPDVEYEAQWGRLVELAGTRLPWWPHRLRLPELVLPWRPGDPTVVTDVPLDTREKALRRAARNPAFGPNARTALTAMADTIHNTHVEHTAQDADAFGRDRPGRKPDAIVVAARPDPDIHRVPEIDDRELLAAGWTEIAASPHPDAVAALGHVHHEAARLLPYGPVTTAPAGAPVVERWARRLAVCDPTAAHATLTDEPADAFFVDPLTDMPALRTTPDHNGRATWIFHAPRALPTGADLATAVLHGTVWITTTTGHVHPAPCHGHSHHLWWGDGGGDRPTEASYVLHQLLDNPTTPVTLDEHWLHAPQPLTTLLNRHHPHGTELTRATLLRTRMTPPDNR